MASFLLRHDRCTWRARHHPVVGEHAREEAPAARVDAEIARTNANLEVVVLTVDSLDQIERTHGRCRLTPAELVRAAFSVDPGACSCEGSAKGLSPHGQRSSGDQRNRH